MKNMFFSGRLKGLLLLVFLFIFPSLLQAEKSQADAARALAHAKDTQDDDAQTDTSYVLQVGDSVNIKIYPEDDYIKGVQMEISSEGNVTLPLVGKSNIAGKTIAEAEKLIAGVLDRDYLVNPEVVIQVQQHHQQTFVILGQVRKPGTYELPVGAKHLTLLQAVSLAGGFSEVANIKKIKIVRLGGEGGENQVIHANADAIISGRDPDIELKAGDVVNVSESLF